MRRRWSAVFLTLVVSTAAPTPSEAQHAPGEQPPPGAQGSTNVRVIAHVLLGRVFTVGDIEIEQELNRPYA